MAQVRAQLQEQVAAFRKGNTRSHSHIHGTESADQLIFRT